MHIQYTSQLFEEDDQVVAVCPELNVSSFGDTSDEALASLQEAVVSFIAECQAMGTLEAVLEEAGYQRDLAVPQRWVQRRPLQMNWLEAVVA